MSKFNLKKHVVKTAVTPYPKRLEDNNVERGLEPAENKIQDKLLDDGRTNKDDNRIYEKQLEKTHTGFPQKNTEGQLNSQADYRGINGMPLRGPDGKPLMDMYKPTGDINKEQFDKADNAGKREKMFWDGYVNTQIPKDQVTKIVANDQPSQLLSNFNTREEFLAENPSTSSTVEEIMNSIKDADAMLYHIYRTSKTESRELNGQEKNIENKINSEKTKLLEKFALHFSPRTDNENNTD